MSVFSSEPLPEMTFAVALVPWIETSSTVRSKESASEIASLTAVVQVVPCFLSVASSAPLSSVVQTLPGSSARRGLLESLDGRGHLLLVALEGLVGIAGRIPAAGDDEGQQAKCKHGSHGRGAYLH